MVVMVERWLGSRCCCCGAACLGGPGSGAGGRGGRVLAAGRAVESVLFVVPLVVYTNLHPAACRSACTTVVITSREVVQEGGVVVVVGRGGRAGGDDRLLLRVPPPSASGSHWWDVGSRQQARAERRLHYHLPWGRGRGGGGVHAEAPPPRQHPAAADVSARALLFCRMHRRQAGRSSQQPPRRPCCRSGILTSYSTVSTLSRAGARADSKTPKLPCDESSNSSRRIQLETGSERVWLYVRCRRRSLPAETPAPRCKFVG